MSTSDQTLQQGSTTITANEIITEESKNCFMSMLCHIYAYNLISTLLSRGEAPFESNARLRADWGSHACAKRRPFMQQVQGNT